MKPVIIESPYADDDFERHCDNISYMFDCITDSISRGEAPFASHGFYAQYLDDDDPKERKQGIESGYAWWPAAEKIVVYEDHGISKGMQAAIDRAKEQGKEIEFRKIGKDAS